jgi:hypothetical protein
MVSVSKLLSVICGQKQLASRSLFSLKSRRNKSYLRSNANWHFGSFCSHRPPKIHFGTSIAGFRTPRKWLRLTCNEGVTATTNRRQARRECAMLVNCCKIPHPENLVDFALQNSPCALYRLSTPQELYAVVFLHRRQRI